MRFLPVILSVVLVMLLLFAGCGEESVSEDRIVASPSGETGVEVAEDVKEPQVDPVRMRVEQQEKEQEEAMQDLAEDIQEQLDKVVETDLPEEVSELIAKSRSITQYMYFYGQDEVHVNGDRIHIILGDPIGDFNDLTMYNEVFLDRAEKKAYVWCTEDVYCTAEENKIYWEADFEEHDIVTPLERLWALDNAEVVMESMCDNRACMKIRFRDSDGLDKDMWIFTYKPIVWKVEWRDDAKGKNFADIYQRIGFKNTADLVVFPAGFKEVIRR